MAFVAPLPQPLPKVLALVQPFHAYLWAALALSLVVTAAALNLVARGERLRRKRGLRFKKWDSLWDTAWYCFGTVLYKSPADEQSHRTNALRHGVLNCTSPIPHFKEQTHACNIVAFQVGDMRVAHILHRDILQLRREPHGIHDDALADQPDQHIETGLFGHTATTLLRQMFIG